MNKRANLDTCWQRCLQILISAKLIGDGWVPGYAFTPPEIGGLNGTRRVRELNTKFGIPYETRNFPRLVNGEKKDNWLYRLGVPPDKIDLENICLKSEPVEPEIKKEKYEQGVLI